MALDNTQLVDFCNDELRQLADQFIRLRIRCQAATAEYNARNLGTIINDGGASNVIVDGSATDGRTQRVGGDVYNFVTMIADYNTWMTQGRIDVASGWNVNGHKG
jgi:hypothetical protein